MAKRKRRRGRGLGGLGAVAHRGKSFRGKLHILKSLKVTVEVGRDSGASTARQYDAQACVGGTYTGAAGRRRTRNAIRTGQARAQMRCGVGFGRTPTAATKSALHRLATKMK